MIDERNLPVVPGDDVVLEGRVMDRAARPVPLRVVQVVRVVVRHDRTKAAGRHLGYIPAGAAIVIKRLWDDRTSARYGRMLRSAEASGNHEAALEWDERLAEFRSWPCSACSSASRRSTSPRSRSRSRWPVTSR
jgi:hypothetical protein